MTELTISIGIAVVLLLLLFFAASQSEHGDEEFLDGEDEGRAVRAIECPPELVRRLFSREDWEFVSKIDSPQLLRVFRKERKVVASQWVRQTSNEISRALREHTRNARNSANLSVAVELQILRRFAGLRMLCGILVVLMRFVDLPVLLGLANRAGRLTDEFLLSRPGLGLRDSATPTTTFNAL
jgi:hypothetical protein